MGLSLRLLISRVNSAKVRDWCCASRRSPVAGTSLAVASRVCPLNVPPTFRHSARNKRSAKSTRSRMLILVEAVHFFGNSPCNVMRMTPSSVRLTVGNFQPSSHLPQARSMNVIFDTTVTRSNTGDMPTRIPLVVTWSPESKSNCSKLVLSSSASGITLYLNSGVSSNGGTPISGREG